MEVEKLDCFQKCVQISNFFSVAILLKNDLRKHCSQNMVHISDIFSERTIKSVKINIR